MATRFYASSDYAPSNLGVSITPAFDTWTSTNNMVRRSMSPRKTGSGITTLFRTKSDSTRRNFGIIQLVSPPLEAGQAITTSDTVRAVFQSWQNATTADCSAKMSVRIFSQDGTTQQTTLLALDTATTNILEWGTTAASHLFPRMSDADPLPTLQNYTTQDGDRIVCDIGWLCANTTFASSQGKISIGDPLTGSDYDFANNQSGSTSVGWVEFSMDLVFKQVLQPRRQRISIMGTGTRRISNSSVIPTELTSQATQNAADFLNSMGVNSHDYGAPNIYSNIPALISATTTLGIPLMRGQPLAGLDSLSSEYKSGYFIGGYGRTTDATTITNAVNAALDAHAQPYYEAGRLLYLEMPNEPDLFTKTPGGSIDPNWPSYVAAYCRIAYPIAKARFPDIPIVGVCLGHNKPTDVASLVAAFDGDAIGDYCDIGNMHSYPGLGLAHTSFDTLTTVPAQLYPGKDIYVTESGYHTAVNDWQIGRVGGINENVQAWYITKMYLEYFGFGIKKFFQYELLDRRPNAESTSFGVPLSPANQQSEANLGLFRGNNSHAAPNTAGAKPVVGILNNLRSMLTGSAPASNATLTYQLDGSPFSHVLLETSTAVYMVIWQRATLWKSGIASTFNIFTLSWQGGSAGVELDPPDQNARLRFSSDKDLTIRKVSDAGATPVTIAGSTVHEFAVPAKDVLIIQISDTVV